ncbi:MAG: DNA primase [Gemmatimonadetes bacterium]|nr:DNA primase [Gemmatimonadota bacterium]
MISDEVVERVRAATDIVQVIGESVPLRRAGGDFRGPCPFHQGTKPNFAVSPRRGTYHCFVCHESGDAFTYVRKRLGMDWPAAVKYLGERAGIEVVDTPARLQPPDPNTPHWEVLGAAAEWFQRQLQDEAMGRDARGYLAGRALDAEACAKFGIGFAPRDGALLRRYLNSLGFGDDRQRDAGLLLQREGEEGLRPRFRGRIMFPIHDELGHPVGFGGRAMGDEEPKYLNSAESPVFQKRRLLYGLHHARGAMRRQQRAIVVEGYLDVIRLVLAGVEEVVAPLGTALTEDQAALLLRYAPEVFLLLDADEAGQAATFKSGKELLRHRAAVRVVTLPDGEDPDSFVRAHGRPAIDQALSAAMDLFDRQLQLVERRGWFADLRLRRRAIDRLLPTIRATRDPLTRDMYLARLATVTGLDKATLLAEADEPDAGSTLRRTPPAEDDAPPPLESPAAEPPPSAAPAGPRPPWRGKGRRGEGPQWLVTSVPPRPAQDEPVERLLVRAMLLDRSVAEWVAERHPPQDFRHGGYAQVYAALLAAAPDEDLAQVAERLDGVALQALRAVSEGPMPTDPAAADLTLLIRRLDVRALEARIDAIREAMRDADPSAQATLMRERLALEADLRHLAPVRTPRRRPSR